MKTTHMIGAAVLIGSALIAGATAVVNDQGGTSNVPAEIPAEPQREPVSVVYAQRFEVAEPYRHMWRSDRPQVSTGWLLVLSASPDLITPRQVREPVLYVGSQTADRVNSGDQSGKLVVLVPGDFLLEDARIFFGQPALPEETGMLQIDVAVERAIAAGVVPPSADHLATVTDANAFRAPTEYELRLRAIELVEKYSPQERDLITGWRAPRVDRR